MKFIWKLGISRDISGMVEDNVPKLLDLDVKFGVLRD